MPTVTFAIPDEVKEEMKKLSWINWSELVRIQLVKEEKLREDFEKFKKIIKKSKLTEKDAKILSDKVKETMHRQLKKEGLV